MREKSGCCLSHVCEELWSAWIDAAAQRGRGFALVYALGEMEAICSLAV